MKYPKNKSFKYKTTDKMAFLLVSM